MPHTARRIRFALAGLVLTSAPALAQAPHGHAAAAAPTVMTQASLRVALNSLLRDHVFLAAGATGAALGGRTAEFQAAAGALDANSIGVSKAIGMVYGSAAGTAFLPLWRRHIGFVVDYTTGLAAQDRAKQDRAVAALVAYTGELGDFFAGANPHLPKEAVAGLVKDHVLTLKAVIDAQAAGDAARAWAATQAAADHMGMIADPLAAAIAKQFPSKFAN